MVETNLVINQRTITYQGIFEMEELLEVLNRAIEARGYKKHEKRMEESAAPQGRSLYLELRPTKQKTNWLSHRIKIIIKAENIRDETRQINRIKHTFQQGDLTITFDAWLLTDYESRWGQKPVMYFLKGIINKWIYRFPLEESFANEIHADTAYIHNQVKAFLNLYKYKAKE